MKKFSLFFLVCITLDTFAIQCKNITVGTKFNIGVNTILEQFSGYILFVKHLPNQHLYDGGFYVDERYTIRMVLNNHGTSRSITAFCINSTIRIHTGGTFTYIDLTKKPEENNLIPSNNILTLF